MDADVLFGKGQSMRGNAVETMPSLAAASPPSAQRHRESLSVLSYVVAIFVILAVAFSTVGSVNVAVKVLGVLLGFVFLLSSFRSRMLLPPEVFLYLAWFTWSLLGVLVAVSLFLFQAKAMTVFQIWVLLVIMTGYTNSRRKLSLVMLACFIAIAIVAVASVVTRSYTMGVAEERLTGLGRNSNGFGRMMVYATACLMYFWMLPTRWGRVKGVALVGLMALFAFGAVKSGSRFSLLGLALLYVLWIFFCYRGAVLRRPVLSVLALFGLIVGAYLFFAFAVEGSLVWRRMFNAWNTLVTGTKSEGSSRVRVEMYRLGGQILLEHPFIGIGLGNFLVVTGRGHSSHSEYVAVAACTGVPGALLYFAIYAVLWRRTRRIRKLTQDPHVKRVAGFTMAVVIVVLFVGLGAPNYYSKIVCILLGLLIGYTNVVWHALQQREGETAGPQSAGALS